MNDEDGREYLTDDENDHRLVLAPATRSITSNSPNG